MPGVERDTVWVEKYRPKSLADMVGQDTIVPVLRAYAEKRSMPHLLFAGPPGTGKTTAAIALARDLFGEEWRQNFLELNASDERGIDTVRTTIKSYARSAPMGGGFKILFLDEADNLTAEAQASLRRLMERYSAACRFILSCNYSSRIIEPIQSRCAVFRFRIYSPDQIHDQLKRVAMAEKREVSADAYKAIIEASDGDLRRAINLLQLAATFRDRVDLAAIRDVVTAPLHDEVEAIFGTALQGDFLAAREQLFRLFVERGASGEDILRSLHSYVVGEPGPPVAATEKIRLIQYLADVDFRLAQGASDRIQLESVLARIAAIKPRAR
ncbi:MAG: replication factor C small subunit [Thermoplasmata archaeon]